MGVRGLTAVMCAAALSLSAQPATAGPQDDKSELDREIVSLRAQLEDTSTDLVDAFVALRRTEEALPGAKSALSLAASQQHDTERRSDELGIALQVAQAQEAKGIERSNDAKRDINGARREVGQFAARLYQDQGMGQLEVAINATTPQEFADRLAMVDTVAGLQRRSIDRLATLRAAAAANESRLTASRRVVGAARGRAQRAVLEAKAARAAAAKAKSRLDALALEQARLAAAVEARKGGEERRLNGLQVESDRLSQVLAARARVARADAAKARARARARARAAALEALVRRAAAARAAAPRAAAPRATAPKVKKRVVPSPAKPSTPVRSGGFLSAPSGGYISSEFGMRFHPILKYWRLHAGRDYAAACGQPVVAAAPGTIVSAGWAGDYGNRVVIDHGIRAGASLATTYNHMSAIAKTSGSVSRGDVIGYIGTTGASTGCHLHFETREDGTPVDPRKWL